MRITRLLFPSLLLTYQSTGALSIGSSLSSWKNEVHLGFERRIAADPAFLKKSVVEVFLAASTQLSAELSQRGSHRMIPEVDFVVAGVLTAIVGKYYSMWRVAKTQRGAAEIFKTEPSIFGLAVPTNAFQEVMLDGVSRPTPKQRAGSLVAPMLPLFQAGVLASIVGYGLTAAAIQIRSILLPSFLATTRQVNIAYAALYTGAFMAIVSNLRYQVLQGWIEPSFERIGRKFPVVLNSVLFMVRILNGWLGSVLAIAGMKALGLQKLK